MKVNTNKKVTLFGVFFNAMSISKFTNYRSKEKEASERVYIDCHDTAVVSSGDQNINRGPSRQQRRPPGTQT